jgi:hypothetical protein
MGKLLRSRAGSAVRAVLWLLLAGMPSALGAQPMKPEEIPAPLRPWRTFPSGKKQAVDGWDFSHKQSLWSGKTDLDWLIWFLCVHNHGLGWRHFLNFVR